MKILYSVVLPTYNRAEHLASCIRSILDQSYKDFELIIVDDGSTDNTHDVISRFKDKRIKYIYQENSERGAARNTGIEVAQGDYVQFIDSDDTFTPFHLELLNHLIKINNRPDIIACNASRKIARELKSYAKYISSDFLIIDNQSLLIGNPFSCNFAIKQNSIRHFFKTSRKLSSMEDWLFLIQNALEDRPIYLLRQQTVKVGLHANQSMQNHQKVIGARMDAVAMLDSLGTLNASQMNSVIAHSELFIAIHHRLNLNLLKSIQSLLKVNLINLDQNSRLKYIYTLFLLLPAFLKSLLK